MVTRREMKLIRSAAVGLVLAAGMVLTPAATTTAAPRPHALALAERTCAGTGGLVSYPTKNAFVPTTSCTFTTSVAGTIYVTASGTAGIEVGGTDGVLEYNLFVDDALQQQSQRQIAVRQDGDDGTDRAIATQAVAAVSAGAHRVRLDGRFTSGNHLQTVQSSISAFFVPSGGDEAGCVSAMAVTVPVSDDFDKTIVTCTLTVTKPGKAAISGSSGFFIKSQRGMAQINLAVDGTPVEPAGNTVTVLPGAGGDPATFASFSGATQAVATLAPGTHTISMYVPSLTANAQMALNQPSVMAVFTPDDSPDVDLCSTWAFGPVTVASDQFTPIQSFCDVAPTADAVLQMTAIVNIGGVGNFSNPSFLDGYEADLAIALDGALAATSERFVNLYPESFAGEHLVALLQLDAPVGAGAHSARLVARNGSNNSTMTFTVLSTVTRIVSGANGGGGAGSDDYTPLVPDRVLDTRPGLQVGYSGPKPIPGQTIELDVTGVGSSKVPDDAPAVVLNVTGTEADAPGFVTVWPSGSPQPTASNLNLQAFVSSPNLVVAKIGTGGKVCLFTQVSAHLIADVNGFMPAGSQYAAVVPERLLDTRAGSQVGYTGDKPAAGAIVHLRITGAGATKVPPSAKSVVLNVTGTQAAAAGFVTVWPCGAPQPTASNLNIAAGGTAPNLVIAKIGDNGEVCIFVQSSMHLIADVAGYMPSGSSYTSVVPERLLDTRSGPQQVGYTGDRPGAGATIELTIVAAGATKVPSGTSAVVLNVTGIEPSTDGFVTVWPCGTERPTASNLNLVAGGISPNLVSSKIGAGGKVCIFTQPSTHLAADILGYWP
jgi:hypothetical protein